MQEENMEKILNIYQRVNCVMKDVTYVKKENKKVNGMYTFVSHDAVTGTLHEPMSKYGIVMIPNIAELEQDGNRTKVKMEISFINIDHPEDKIVITQYGYGIDPQDKGIGKAQSYAVKYALLKLFCLETGDDVEKDNINYEPAKPVVDPVLLKKAMNERKKEIADLVDPLHIEELKTYFAQLKQTFKSQKEEEIILCLPAEEFVKNFYAWKGKIENVA